MENYTFIDNEENLIEFRKYMCNNNINKIALDFEGEYNLHAYGEKLCLIQIFDGDKYFIIDPLKIDDGEIAKTLANKKTVKYMYGVESDLGLIYKQYGIKLNNVFDQKILVDVLNLSDKGLDGVIKSLFGIENKQKAKFQKYNWIKRPIEENALIYALNDVKYLFEINEILTKRIIIENKINDLIIAIINRQYDFDKERCPSIFKKIDFKQLSEKNKTIFIHLYEIREGIAKSLNMPPHNILENKMLFDIVNKRISTDKIKFNKRISSKIAFELIENIKNLL
jgi:ribonuclease D